MDFLGNGRATGWLDATLQRRSVDKHWYGERGAFCAGCANDLSQSRGVLRGRAQAVNASPRDPRKWGRRAALALFAAKALAGLFLGLTRGIFLGHGLTVLESAGGPRHHGACDGKRARSGTRAERRGGKRRGRISRAHDAPDGLWALAPSWLASQGERVAGLMLPQAAALASR